MTPAEVAAIKPIIDRMIADTQAAEMNWIKISPTGFVWRKMVDGKMEAQLSLQKTVVRQPTIVPGPPVRQVMQAVENYIFQVTEFPSGNVRMIINTQQDPEALVVLKNLFDVISANADKGAVDYLKRIIESG